MVLVTFNTPCGLAGLGHGTNATFIYIYNYIHNMISVTVNTCVTNLRSQQI